MRPKYIHLKFTFTIEWVVFKINPQNLLIMKESYILFSGTMTGSDENTQHRIIRDETPENKT